MKRQRKRLRLNRASALTASALLVAAAMLTSAGAAEAASNTYVPPGVSVLAGANPQATAIAIAQAEYPNATTAILASGQSADLLDAVLASPLAKALEAPILLTASASQIGSVTLQGLTQLGITHVILVGADAANASAIQSQLPPSVSVQASYGSANAATTAAALAAALRSAQHTYAFSSVFVVSDNLANLTDAISAAPAAAMTGSPILVAPTTGAANLPSDEALYAETAATTYLIGAAVAVNVSGNSRLVPLVGADRSWTALDIDNQFMPATSHVFVYNAQQDLAQAVTMAPLVAADHGALLDFYSPALATPNGTNMFLSTITDTTPVNWMTIIGPTSLVSAADATTLETALTGLGDGVQTLTLSTPSTAPVDSIVGISAAATSAKGAAVSTPASWSISGPNAADAVIGSSGSDSAEFVAVTPGTYTISATVDGFTSTQTLSVTAASAAGSSSSSAGSSSTGSSSTSASTGS